MIVETQLNKPVFMPYTLIIEVTTPQEQGKLLTMIDRAPASEVRTALAEAIIGAKAREERCIHTSIQEGT